MRNHCVFGAAAFAILFFAAGCKGDLSGGDEHDGAVSGADAGAHVDGGAAGAMDGAALADGGMGPDAGAAASDAGGATPADAGVPVDAFFEPGATRYVDGTLGVDSCTTYAEATRSCTGGSATAYRTLAAGAAAAMPGERIVIRAGDYGETLRPARSGEASRPILFTVLPGEVARITGALTPGVDLQDRAYITLDGLHVENVVRWLYAMRVNHIEVRNCTFRNATDAGGSGKTGLFFQDAELCRIEDNVIDTSTQDNLSLLRSNRNVVQRNTFREARHTLWTIKCGNQNVIRDNTFYNSLEKIGEIFDCDGVGFDHEITALDATKWNLVEGNRFTYTPSSGDHSPYAGIQYAGQHGIIRRNLFYDTVGPALDLTFYADEAMHTDDNRVVHNVFSSTDFAGLTIASGATASIVKNNVLTASRFVANDTRWTYYTAELMGKPVQVMVADFDGYVLDNNVIFGSAVGDRYTIAVGQREPSPLPTPHTLAEWQTMQPALFVRNLDVDPTFVDGGGHDFHLRYGSPCIDAGAFLTRTTAAGSGTALVVDDDGYFYDGFAISGEVGDAIQLEGGAEPARIVSIDRTTHTLTLDRALTWSAGQGVAYAFHGRRPDVGAIER